MMTSDDPLLCGSWNFGPRVDDGAACVGDLIEAFCTAWGSGNWEDKSDPEGLHESNALRLSIEKAVSLLNWMPVWSLREAIDRTAQWYADYYGGHGKNMHDACLGDIESHQEKARQASQINWRQTVKRGGLAA